MQLLILGGTAEARQIAERLHQQGVALIYSVAGLVRIPQASYRVVSGGFSQFGGMVNFMRKESISAVLDATHPYAQKISSTAIIAAQSGEIPCWRLHRLPWQQQPGDNWQTFENWQDLLPQLADKKSVFLTTGQIQAENLDQLIVASAAKQKLLIRTAAEPAIKMPNGSQWIKAIGPFKLEDERALMQKYQIDALVSKNSGGAATVAKIQVARELGIPVYLLARPSLPQASKSFTDLQQCKNYILQRFSNAVGVRHAV